jgi:hypothetical protein
MHKTGASIGLSAVICICRCHATESENLLDPNATITTGGADVPSASTSSDLSGKALLPARNNASGAALALGISQ